MSAIDTIERIINSQLINIDLKYCLVDEHKLPHKLDGSLAKTTIMNDFVSFESLLSCENLDNYAGLGISIQASNVSGVDIDKCVSTPFDASTISDDAKKIIDIFKSWAYIEFSFSGTGIRILFRQPIIKEYREKYYIKNSKRQIEFYQPAEGKDLSNRFLTITGMTLYNNALLSVDSHSSDIIYFLDTYMKRQVQLQKITASIYENDNRSLEALLRNVKLKMLSNGDLMNLWFTPAPGSGKDESERDYRLLKLLYKHITKDKDKLKEVFESSPFFKSKDDKHLQKWTKLNYRYFNYLYDNISKYL